MLLAIELIVGLQEKVEASSLDFRDDFFAFGEYLKEDDTAVLEVRNALQAFLFFQTVHEVCDGWFGDLQVAADLGHGDGAQEH